MLRALGCLHHEHNVPLLILAVVVCCAACFVSVGVVRRAALVNSAQRTQWSLGAGLVYGSGIWATHFIAMLALQPGLPMSYAPGLTGFSALIGVAGAAVAFQMTQALEEAGQRRALTGGTVLGLTVGAMHYVGMSAIRLPGMIEFSTPHVIVSVLAGGGLAALALARSLETQRERLIAAGLLAASILSLHFTGMAGATIVPDGTVTVSNDGLDEGLLAVTIAAVVSTVTAVSLVGTIFDEKLWGERTRDAERLRRLVNGTFEGLLIHRAGIILDVNDALARLAGRPAKTLIGQDLAVLLPPGASDWCRAMPGMNASESPPPTLEVELIAGDGRSIPVELLYRQIEDASSGKERVGPACAVAVRDLTERKRAEAQIRYLAHHDGLTGLPNRALFADRANQVVELARREQGSAAVLCLDLDRFKMVNDMLGHEGGDQLLLQVAERLRGTLRASDTVARLGGDEFAIVKGDLDASDAAALAGRVITALAVPFELQGQSFQIGTSVGIALFPADGRTVPRLLRNADTALYRAKREGRNTHRFFEPAMDKRLMERRAMERDLRGALDRGEFHLVYQPQFDTQTLEVEGQEALLRWTHPVRGAVSPAEFVPLAEEAGLIIQLGRWVLETACAEAVTWPIPCRLAVNLSPAQFRQPDLIPVLAGILKSTGLPPQRLKLEVTEGLLIGDTEHTLSVMRAMKEMGVLLSLDDFGTGYSSLGYLRRFPFDEIKIDRSFVNGIGRNVESLAIIEAVLGLGRSLGLDVVAEGVETQEHLSVLRSRGCPWVQGFLLGRPARSEALCWHGNPTRVEGQRDVEGTL